MFDISVSLDRTLAASLFSTRALISSANGSREAVTGYLRVVEVFQPANEIIISGHDWRNAEVYVTCLPAELMPNCVPAAGNR
jgi:hypothetical protein